MSACFPSRSGAWKIPRTAATAGLFSPGSAKKGRRIWQGRRRRRLPGPCMNGGWRAWRKGTALHYRKNCLPFNVNKQAGEDGVCGGRISVPVCPERRKPSESREWPERRLVLAVHNEGQMMLGGWGAGILPLQKEPLKNPGLPSASSTGWKRLFPCLPQWLPERPGESGRSLPCPALQLFHP